MKAEGADVVRHYCALEDSLRNGSVLDKNINKILVGLKQSLTTDGFVLESAPAPSAGHTFALRVRDAFDTDVLSSVFSSIPGWKVRSLVHKDNFFVVVSNVKRLTEKRIKQAVKEYIVSLPVKESSSD